MDQLLNGPWASIVWMLFLFGFLWFVMIRPQQKAQKKHKDLLENLKVNDKVMTAGGMYGIVTKIADDRVTLKIADNVKVEFSKVAVRELIED